MDIEDLISQISQAAVSCEKDGEQSVACQNLADELLALNSIYALDNPGALQVVSIYEDPSQPASSWRPRLKVRLVLELPLDLSNISPEPSSSSPPTSLRLSITLPAGYPSSSSAPQLQLLDRFLGQYEVDTALFGQVLRTFFHDGQDVVTSSDRIGGGAHGGVRWQSGEVVLFEGCESVKERVEGWYKEQRRSDEQRRKRDGRGGVGAVVMQEDGGKEQGHGRDGISPTASDDEEGRTSTSMIPLSSTSAAEKGNETISRLVATKTWTSTTALVERKSTFIGHAVRLDRPEEVPLLLRGLLHLYPRLSKATHPLMRAWICSVQDEEAGGRRVVHRDCDDDGESAAGGRLAHLLEMLHLDNALVVVTRYYGGIHLGADRFKLINRVARDALDLAGLLRTSSTNHGGKAGQNGH